MRDDHIDLCGQVDFTRTEAMPLLEREAQFCFACAGCGDCCRGREDIVHLPSRAAGALRPACVGRRKWWRGGSAGQASAQ